MFITKRELNRRIETALAEQDRERWRNERINELERRMDRNNEELFKRICELERIIKTDAVRGVVDANLVDHIKCKCQLST